MLKMIKTNKNKIFPESGFEVHTHGSYSKMHMHPLAQIQKNYIFTDLIIHRY